MSTFLPCEASAQSFSLWKVNGATWHERGTKNWKIWVQASRTPGAGALYTLGYETGLMDIHDRSLFQALERLEEANMTVIFS